MDSLKVMILAANRYEFEDEKTKRMVSGTTVHYVSLVPVADENKVGLVPAKATLSYEAFRQFEGMAFPSVAEASIQIDLSNSRKPFKISGFQVLEPVQL